MARNNKPKCQARISKEIKRLWNQNLIRFNHIFVLRIKNHRSILRHLLCCRLVGSRRRRQTLSMRCLNNRFIDLLDLRLVEHEHRHLSQCKDHIPCHDIGWEPRLQIQRCIQKRIPRGERDGLSHHLGRSVRSLQPYPCIPEGIRRFRWRNCS